MPVRTARPADAAAIARLWLELMAHHRERDPFFTPGPEGERLYTVFVRRAMADPDWRILVAETPAGDLAGYVVGALQAYPPVYRTTGHGYVQDLVVTREARGQGLGRALFEALAGWFGDRGVARLEVDVSAFNQTGVAFWEAMGFGPFMVKLARTRPTSEAPSGG